MSADLAVLVGVLWLAQALIARLNRGTQIESRLFCRIDVNVNRLRFDCDSFTGCLCSYR